MTRIMNTRTALVNWIAKQNNKYLLTVTFKAETSDKLAERSFKHVLHLINQKVHCRRYKKNNKFVEGIAVREQQKNGTLHYHAILFEVKHKLRPTERMKTIIQDVCRRITIPDRPGKRLISDNGVDLQVYYNTNGSNKLERYITKTFGNRRYIPKELNDNLGPLDKDGALFGLDPFKYF